MIKREEYLKKIRGFYDQDLIKVITGIRRSGKSTLLKQIIDELKDKGVKQYGRFKRTITTFTSCKKKR